MLQRILVPLDGSRVSEGVLPAVLALSKSSKAGLVLMHAVTPSEYFSVTAAEQVHLERQRSAAYLKFLVERLRREGCQAQERILTGEASQEIVAEARRDHVDLIAMSTHGRSGIKEWPFGSVTERVLKTTRTPVLMFREGQSWGPMVRNILVALDGTEESLEALPSVLDVAQATRSAVTLLHGGKCAPPALPVAQKMLMAHHVPFDVKVLSGKPVEAILGAVRKEHADLLALTTTGRNSTEPDWLGSAADEILKQCDRPLLVVHTGRTS
jgi:nucleotide-binding universal stress UspA family protein